MSPANERETCGGLSRSLRKTSAVRTYIASDLLLISGGFFMVKNAISEETAVESAGIPKKKKVYFTAQRIAYLALLIAVNVVVSIFSPRLGTLKITLTYTTCFLAGYFFGPVNGGLVGGIGDVIGCFVGGGYAPNPIILCSSVLIGVIPGLVSYIKIPGPKKAVPYFHIALSYVFVFVVCTLFITTYGLYLMGLAKGNTFWAYMAVRAGTQTPVTAVNFALTLILYPVFLKIFRLNVDKTAIRRRF